MQTAFQGYEKFKEEALDAVLLVKQWACSDSLSQKPLLLLPVKALDQLLQDTIVALGRKEFSARTAKEFLKTAEFVERQPWRLLRAGEYIRGWGVS